MTRQKEELLNDPAAFLILKKASGHGEKSFEQLSRDIGVEKHRARKRARGLESFGLIKFEKGSKIVFEEKHERRVKSFRNSILDFAESHYERLSGNFQKAAQLLEESVEKLRKEKEETESVREEKKIEKKIQAVEKALYQEHDSPRKSLKAFSRVHRARKFVSVDVEFHGFNPVRKAKTLSRLEEVLDGRPEDERPRTFFGNRWVTRSSLE